MTRKELLDLALASVGGDEAELAQRLGMTNVNSAATEFNRWRKGKSMAFERTIAMLEIAGLLRRPEERATALDEEAVAAELRLVSRALERARKRLAPDAVPLEPPQSANGGE